MAAVPGHGHPIAALQRHHSLNRDITGFTCALQKSKTSIHWTVDALVLSVAIILYNKIDLNFLCKHGGFLQIQLYNNECDHKLMF